MTTHDFIKAAVAHSSKGDYIISSRGIGDDLAAFTFGDIYFNLCHSYGNYIIFEDLHNMKISECGRVVKPVSNSHSFFMAIDAITEIQEFNGDELKSNFAYNVERIFEIKYKTKYSDNENACIIGFLGYKFAKH